MNYNYTEEQKTILDYYLNTELFPLHESGKHYVNKNDLEIIVRSQCNQSCEYCYLTKYRNSLYPNEPLEKETILNNINLLLDYVYNVRKNFFYNIELFAGDLFYDDIFFDIIDLIYKYLIEIKNIEPQLFFFETHIMIPSNLSFAYTHPEKADKVIHYADKMYKELNTRILFSWSTDGPYGVDSREKKELPKDYFNTILKFCKKLEIGMHPMTAAANVPALKMNYDWWLEVLDSFYEDNVLSDFQPMMLEVRNGNEWTNEIIDCYLDFLTYAFNLRLTKICNNDPELLAKQLFCQDLSKFAPNEYKYTDNYDFLRLRFSCQDKDSENERVGCSMQHSVMLNSTNLSLVICHRLAYENMTGAFFKVENNKIVDILPHNFDTYFTAKSFKLQNSPFCNKCPIEKLCLHGCLGAQYEYSGELFFPIPSVCNLFKRKMYHLLRLHDEHNLLDIAYNNGYIERDTYEYMLQVKQALAEELEE